MLSLTRVGVLDEQEVVHYGVRACLSGLSDISVAGAYFCPGSAVQAIGRGGIDLLLMGAVRNCKSNLDFVRNLHTNYSSLRVLVFLAEPCTATITLLVEAGAHGVVCKRQPLDECVQAIRLLAKGQRYCCTVRASVESGVASHAPTGVGGGEAALLSVPSLSLREREVLRLCISGLTVTCIAERFGRSLKTVSTQKQAAYRKLGLKNDMDLFRRLAQHGL